MTPCKKRNPWVFIVVLVLTVFVWYHAIIGVASYFQ